jgi:post-segregation antitoxin (ccd killing protein)
MKLWIIPLAALLASCQTASTIAAAAPVITGGPVVLADRTVMDETAGRSIELAYMAARTVAEIAVDAGLLKGERAAQVQVLNRRAYATVLAARAAYRAGNSDGWLKASREAQAAVAQFLNAAKGQ